MLGIRITMEDANQHLDNKFIFLQAFLTTSTVSMTMFRIIIIKVQLKMLRFSALFLTKRPYVVVNLSVSMKCVHTTIPHISSHMIQVTVQRGEREVSIEEPDVSTEVSSISIRARPQPHKFRRCFSGVQMNFPTSTAESWCFRLELLHVAMLAILNWFQHVGFYWHILVDLAIRIKNHLSVLIRNNCIGT
jgi:hypothetical protein